MMKKIKLIVIAGLVFLYAQMIFAISTAQPLKLNDNMTIAPEITHQEDKSQGTRIDLVYPQIKGVSLSENEGTFNQLVKSMMASQVAQFKKDAHLLSSKHNNLSINYQVYVSKPDEHHIISVLFTSESMMEKQAHPVHAMLTLNYDLSTGKALTLSELFEPHSGYRSVIADYSKTVLKQKFPELQPFAAGLEPTPENFSVWNLRAADILIHFKEAQVAPRVYGTIEVAVPYQVLKEVPLAPWLMHCVDHPERCVAPSN
ncbi:MAG TPA: DUF3298 domain-containing protein [Gammaproteobacteria bacterium]|nr:DUF3298 domain-containing protein [Gammaproteobacteria bacterium]